MTRYGFPNCPEQDKHHFMTEDQAKTRLAQIMRRPDPWRDKNPHRYYECPCGGGWTLSSNEEWDEGLAPPEPPPTLHIPRPKRDQEKRLRRFRR